MARSLDIVIHGYPFIITVGSGNYWKHLNGIVVSPNQEVTPQWCKALKKVQELYPEIESYYSTLDTYEMLIKDKQALYDLGSMTRHQLMNDLMQLGSAIKWILSEDAIEILDKAINTLRDYDIPKQQPLEKPTQTKSYESRPGYVYLLRAIEPHNHYKIGRSSQPKKRIETLSVKLPYPIKPICLIKTDDMIELESNLHNMFDNKRVGGEWFQLDDTDIEYIKSLVGEKS